MIISRAIIFHHSTHEKSNAEINFQMWWKNEHSSFRMHNRVKFLSHKNNLDKIHGAPANNFLSHARWSLTDSFEMNLLIFFLFNFFYMRFLHSPHCVWTIYNLHAPHRILCIFQYKCWYDGMPFLDGSRLKWEVFIIHLIKRVAFSAVIMKLFIFFFYGWLHYEDVFICALCCGI